MKQFFLQSAFFIAFFTSSFLSASALASISTSNINLVPSGLVGYWNFDGKNMTNATATDVSGNGNNGALIGMTTASSKTIGKLGQALTFDAADDKINMGTPSALNITSAITISAWIYPRSFGAGSRGRIVDKLSNVTNGYAFFVDNSNVANGISFAVNTGAGGPNNTLRMFSNTITFNKWQHVLATISESNILTVYVNGVSVGSGTFDFPTSSSNNFVIGGRTTDDARNFDGRIDDVRVYNRAITLKEIEALYKAGTGALAATTPTANQNGTGIASGLVGYWNFDGKNMTNATATDISGNANNGTLIGMTTASSKTIGKLGQALTFDAADDKINMGTPSTLNITSTITISAWIYPRSFGGGSSGRIVDKDGDTTSGYTLFVDNANRANSMTFCTNTCVGSVGTPNVITLNKWQHVVVTQSATTLTHYVNGVQVYSGAAIAAPLTSSNNFVIGGRTTDELRNFDGRIDDVRVYNRNLSLQEVQALYKVGQVATDVSPTINTSAGGIGINSGLVGHFTFDGKNMTNATATDISGNGNNGALIGMTTASSKTTGKLGQALTFSSSSLSYISVPQNGRYNITTTAFTVSFWVKNDTPSSGVSTTFHQMISWYDGTRNVQVGLGNATTPANTRQYYVFNDAVNAPPAQVTAINGGVSLGWHHVTATFNGSTYTLYVDGVASGGGTTATSVGVFTGNSTTLYIGQRGDNVAATFTTGPIDDVRFYNRALSPIEVKSLYKLGSQ